MKLPLKDRILSNIYINPISGCWEWTKATTHCGYGIIRITDTKNGVRKLLRVHRVTYKLFVGEISDNLFVLHKCDNRKCCNPEHLFLGTHQDNMDDMHEKGRHVAPYSFLGKQHTEESKKKIAAVTSVTMIGSGNSQYGTMWITNGFDNKKLKQGEVMPNGWRKGRIVNY